MSNRNHNGEHDFGNTSIGKLGAPKLDLNQLTDKDGKLFGLIQADEKFVSAVNNLYNNIIAFTGTQVRGWGGQMAESLAKNLGTTSAKGQLRAYSAGANTLGLGIILMPELLGTMGALRDAAKTLADTQASLAPYFREKGCSPTLGLFVGEGCRNEVVEDARKKVMNLLWNRMVGNVASSAGRAPLIYNNMRQHHQEMEKLTAERAGDLKAELAIKAPEKAAESRQKYLRDFDEVNKEVDAREGLSSDAKEYLRKGLMRERGYDDEAKKKQDDSAAMLDSRTLTGQLTAIASTGLSSFLRQTFAGDIKQLSEQSVAMEMIVNLCKQMEENPSRKTIVAKIDGREREYTIAQYVHEIFQQHQHTRGQSPISARFLEHAIRVDERGGREGTREVWDEKRLQDTPEEDLSAYECSVKHIASLIGDGKMNSMALIDLVGDRLIVQSSGRTFGTSAMANLQNRPEELKAALTDVIDGQAVLHSQRFLRSEEDIQQYFADRPFTPQDVAQILNPTQGLQGMERAFFASLMPDEVVEKALMSHGIGEKDARLQTMRMRKEMQGRFENALSAAVEDVVQRIEKNPEMLDNMHFTQREWKKLQELAAKLPEHPEALQDAMSRAGGFNGVESSIANATVNMLRAGSMSAEEPGRWTQKILAESEQPHPVHRRATSKAVKARGSEDDRPMRANRAHDDEYGHGHIAAQKRRHSKHEYDHDYGVRP